MAWGRPKFNFDTAWTVRSQTSTRASGRRARTAAQSTPAAWCGLSENPLKDCFAPHDGFNAETARFVFRSAPRPAGLATSSSFFNATPGSAFICCRNHELPEDESLNMVTCTHAAGSVGVDAATVMMISAK